MPMPTPPMGGQPPGGMPPGGHPPMGPPPTGTGPASGLGGMAGNQQAGMEKIKMGLKALTEAIPMLPLGGELQSEIMKAVQGIGKHLAEGGAGGDPQALVQQLAMMARNAKQEAPAGFAGLMGGGGGAPPPPGAGAGAPPPPPMGA